MRFGRRIARNGERLPIPKVETGGLVAGEWPGTSPAEDRDLVSTFVYGAVTVDSFGDRECRAASAVGRD
jgi:hypothetical protein